MKNIKHKKIFTVSLVLLLTTSANIMVASADFDPNDQSTIYSVQSRLRELGYFNYRATATYGDMTKAMVNTFRTRNSLGTSNLLDQQTYTKLFQNDVTRKAIATEVSLPIGPQTGSTAQGGTAKPFSEVTNSFKVGDTITIYDYITGKSLSLKRTGGTNHADTVLSGSSTVSNLKEIFGNTFTWEKRSAVAIIDDQRVAAAMSVFQDDTTIKIIVYFTGSASDIEGTLDVEYSDKILQAIE